MGIHGVTDGLCGCPNCDCTGDVTVPVFSNDQKQAEVFSWPDSGLVISELGWTEYDQGTGLPSGPLNITYHYETYWHSESPKHIYGTKVKLLNVGDFVSGSDSATEIRVDYKGYDCGDSVVSV